MIFCLLFLLYYEFVKFILLTFYNELYVMWRRSCFHKTIATDTGIEKKENNNHAIHPIKLSYRQCVSNDDIELFSKLHLQKNASQKILTLNSRYWLLWNRKLISHRLNNIFVWHLRIEFSKRKTIHVQMFIQNFELFSIIDSVKNQQMNGKSMRHKLYGEIKRANHCNRSL